MHDARLRVTIVSHNYEPNGGLPLLKLAMLRTKDWAMGVKAAAYALMKATVPSGGSEHG